MAVTLSGDGGTLNGRLGIAMTGNSTSISYNSSTTSLAVKIFLYEAKTLASVLLAINTRTGTGCDLLIDLQTSSATTNGTPSGTSVAGFTPQVWLTGSVTLGVPTLIPLDAGNQVTLQPFTTYWLVVSQNNFTTGNYVSIRCGYATQGNGSNVHAYITKTAASWTANASASLATGVVVRFSDGSDYGQPYGGSIVTTPPYTLYGSRIVRVTFTPTVSILCDGLDFKASKAASAGDLLYVLRDSTGTAMFSGTIDAIGQISSATARQLLLPIPATWLYAGQTYWIDISSPTVSTSANNWAYSYLATDVPSTDARAHTSSFLNMWASTTADGTTWIQRPDIIVPLALSVVSLGDFGGSGQITMDSAVRDGATGYSVRLRAHTDTLPYYYSRYYVASDTGSKSYSVKMRRDATAGNQPSLQRVELIRAGSVIATLNADSGADGAWATYTASGLSLSTGDVIQVKFSTQLKPGQTDTTLTGQAWFDTESWT